MATFISIKCEASPGARIDKAAQAAQSMADENSVNVEFDFNGVRCVAEPGGDPETLVERQQGLQGQKPTARSGK